MLECFGLVLFFNREQLPCTHTVVKIQGIKAAPEVGEQIALGGFGKGDQVILILQIKGKDPFNGSARHIAHRGKDGRSDRA